MRFQLCLVVLMMVCLVYAKKKKKADDDDEEVHHVVTDIATVTFQTTDEDGDVLREDVKIGLFGDLAPVTVLNFKGLCQGQGKRNKLSYKNTKCHRLVKDMLVQCGDVVNNDGTGSRSIYGKEFNDENFKVSHRSGGIVSMANRGKNTNGSQFFILFSRSRYLDGNHVAFGKVLEGMKYIEKLNELGTKKDYAEPINPIKIADCSVEGNVQRFEIPDKVMDLDDPETIKKAESSRQP